MNCLVCGIEFEGRADARYCSPKCRKEAFLKRSVGTDKLDYQERIIEDVTFHFKTVSYDLNISQPERQPAYTNRTAKYWYDVPLGAVPVIQKGWPAMPDYMNGRQYFLWWKNEFKVNAK